MSGFIARLQEPSGLLGELKENVKNVKEFVDDHSPSAILEGAFKSVKGGLDGDQDHDSIHEKEVDRIRETIREQHRFRSFAEQRRKNVVKWFIDGHDFFWAASEIIDAAQECIFILDWWTSPELYLRRPAADYGDWRLDRLLKRKAEQGVKVYVIVYKEVTETMNMGSKHTKSALEALHSNIKVMRHPDHIGTEHDILFWSHHEKLLVVDNHRACIGGLDLCFGRWDTHDHLLADVHPTDFSRTLFPGQDYNNARVLDFQQVDNFVANQISILDTARMPWHDVHMCLMGDAVLDVVQHFVERWNKIKKEKYTKQPQYDWLAFPHNIERFPNEAVAGHPFREQWDAMGVQYKNRWHEAEERAGLNAGLDALTPFQPPSGSSAQVFEETHPRSVGTCDVQVIRSVSDWSHGTLKEASIQDAYIQLIREANHFIYIENQFFISNATDSGPVVNKIAKALVERILQAAKDGQKFKVLVVIPEVPAFSGDIEDASAIQTIMAAQWRTINRGGSSIYELIRKAGFEPTDYIRFYHLRCYDRINAPAGFLNEMKEKSGVSFFQAQVAQARLFLGDDSTWKQDSIKITEPSRFKDEKSLATTERQGTSVIEEVKFPANTAEAKETIKKFQAAASRSDDNVEDNVGEHALQTNTKLQDEVWLGTEAEERDCYVTELVYIHSKVMIVDDRRVIMGSANLNDRSQKGDGDSEIALIVEDTDMIECKMNGTPYMAGRFAATLRRKIVREHLGLIPPQPCMDPISEPTSFMRAPPFPSEDETGQEEDEAVSDPLSDTFLTLWDNTARENRQVFSEIFKTVPTDVVRNWDQYKTFLPKNIKTGHIATDLPLPQVKEKLATIRGTLVTAPINFLIEETNLTGGTNPDWLGLNPTLPIYL